MTESLFVQTDGLREFAQTHAQVAEGLAAVPVGDAAGVEATHGPIASAVSAALADALGVRRDALETTSRSGNRLSDLLLRAAQAYERGDQRGSAALRAAADAIENGGAAPVAPAAAAPTATAPSAQPAGGAEMAGQLAGQIGQQVAQAGQLAAQAALAPFQAIAQPLQQLPQQLAQMLAQAGQPVVESADDLTEGATLGDRPDADLEDRDDRNDHEDGPDDRVPGEETDRSDEAGPGDRPDAVRTPGVPPTESTDPAAEAPHRARPAPTRPAG